MGLRPANLLHRAIADAFSPSFQQAEPCGFDRAGEVQQADIDSLTCTPMESISASASRTPLLSLGALRLATSQWYNIPQKFAVEKDAMVLRPASRLNVLDQFLPAMAARRSDSSTGSMIELRP